MHGNLPEDSYAYWIPKLAFIECVRHNESFSSQLQRIYAAEDLRVPFPQHTASRHATAFRCRLRAGQEFNMDERKAAIVLAVLAALFQGIIGESMQGGGFRTRIRA